MERRMSFAFSLPPTYPTPGVRTTVGTRIKGDPLPIAYWIERRASLPGVALHEVRRLTRAERRWGRARPVCSGRTLHDALPAARSGLVTYSDRSLAVAARKGRVLRRRKTLFKRLTPNPCVEVASGV